MIWKTLEFTFFTWFYFLAMCSIKRAHDAKTLPKILYPISLIMVLIFGIMDALFNFFIGSILFLEPPRELLFTSRCDLNLNSKNWRGSMARFWCNIMLNPFDPNHCHPE